MSETRIRALFLAVVVAMAAYCATHLELSTNVTNFLPEKSKGEFAVLASRLADSELTRTMILTLNARDGRAPVAAARELAHRLAADPQVEWIRAGFDSEQLEPVYRMYFPRRYRFLSDQPEAEIPTLVTPQALRERARAVREELALPTATLTKRLVAADPLGAFERILARFRQQRSHTLRTDQGQFVTADGRYAVIFLATKASAFDSKPQGQFLGRLRADFQTISEQHGGGLVLEESGANRFAVAAERSIRRDVVVISAVAFLGVAAVFLAFLRSLHFFLLAVFPSLVGILTAATATRLVFGHLDGLTMAFGASLIGVAIDYSIHVIDHYRLDPDSRPREVVRRIRPSLTLGALTTMASFAGLVLTAFPGFREIGFFAIVGVGAALGVTLVVLPSFLGGGVASGEAPILAHRVARGLGDGVRALSRRRRVLASVPLACLVLTALFLPHLHFVDDLSRLMAVDPGLRAEEIRVRERVARMQDPRVVVALGADAEAAVALDDRVAARLEQARSKNVLSGFRSLHAFLWSRELQDRNLRVLESIPDLADRVDAAFAAEGFRPAALAPFRASLAATPAPPLSAKELRASPLGSLISSFLLNLGDRVAAVTYLRGVHSVAGLKAALDGLPHVHVFDQKSFLNEVYRQFRITTLEQVGVGSVLVVLVLGLRYRRWRPVLAALLPSLLAAGVLLAVFSAFGVGMNLLHVTSLTMVMGMGVDYGIFMVDSAHQREGFDATMLSLLLCCLTTVFVFGTLALSSQPALRAIGATTGLGILLSFVLAPVTLVVLRGEAGERKP